MDSAADDIRSLTVVLAIPTFRRPELLARLLPSLLENLQKTGAKLLVADNDCDPQVEKIIHSFSERWAETFYFPVQERGLSAVRNAIIRDTFTIASDWNWLVMIDDDTLVSPHWLVQLLSCGLKYKTHLVGGPVDGVLPPNAGLLARNSVMAGRKRFATGPVETLNGTHNLAISRSLFDLLPEPLFSSNYNFSGGEDYDFFRRVRKAGGKMAWCNEASTYEPATELAVTPFRILKRYYTTGAYMARIDKEYNGSVATIFHALKGMIASFCRLLLGILKGKMDVVARECLSLAHYGGRILGLFGWQSARYGSPEKQV